MKLKETMKSKDAILIQFRAFRTEGGHEYVTVNKPTKEKIIEVIKELYDCSEVTFKGNSELPLNGLEYNKFSNKIEFYVDGSYESMRFLTIKIYN